MNIAVVNPIAVTPDVSLRSLLAPRIAPITDPQALREINIVELGGALAELGNDVHVLVGDAFLDGHAVRLADHLEVVPVRTILRRPFHPGLLPLTVGLAQSPGLDGADVIQASEFHQPSTFLASRAAQSAGAPLVVWQETFRLMQPPGSWYQRAFGRLLGGDLRRRVGRFVPRTTRARDFLLSLGVSPQAIGPWIPTGIDVERFSPGPSQFSAQGLGWAEDARILLGVGRLHRGKGFDVALLAFAAIRKEDASARLVIVGDGPELMALRRLAEGLGISKSVRFLGKRPRGELVDWYRLAYLVLSTSKNDLLPFGLIEASGCGCPSVAMDVGAIRDIVVDGETGSLVGSGDVLALVRSVLGLLRNPDERDRCAAGARARAQEVFALRTIARRLGEVYRDVAG